MQKITIFLPEIKLVGITTRTNNKAMFERDPSINKIAALVQKYFHNGLSTKITNRQKPNTTYCAYTDYESDHHDDFTYFIGEEVSSFDNLPKEFTALTIPTQNYAKFTKGPGPMPDICIDLWQNIWQMNPKDFGAPRSYQTDFEIYDERALDHQHVVFDIFIGIDA
ncbi:MAG: GyrI-like domain-containing protein [Alphaproteobacteria bacterium]|nr:GyrI-like domain-containing protein [Alphaproteobacteria bacterium]